jgi:hypothetical protein
VTRGKTDVLEETLSITHPIRTHPIHSQFAGLVWEFMAPSTGSRIRVLNSHGPDPLRSWEFVPRSGLHLSLNTMQIRSQSALYFNGTHLCTDQPRALFRLQSINPPKPGAHFIHTTRFDIKKFYVLPTLYLCVLYGSQNKQWLLHYTALTGCFL